MGSAVPREKRALNDLGQVHKREHWLVEVREVTTKDIFFVRRELLDCVVVQDQFRKLVK
jgi:hypothetical protein